MRKPLRVGLIGLAGSGKDTAAAALVAAGWQRVAFADQVRRFVEAANPQIGNCTLADLVAGLGWEQAKREIPAVRRTLVEFGQAARHVLGSDVWLNAALNQTTSDRTVYTDVRFPNEAEAMTFTVRIVRPGVDIPQDPADRSAAGLPADFTIVNNSTKTRLQRQLVDVLTSVGIDMSAMLP
jgi:hypothetical protein